MADNNQPPEQLDLNQILATLANLPPIPNLNPGVVSQGQNQSSYSHQQGPHQGFQSQASQTHAQHHSHHPHHQPHQHHQEHNQHHHQQHQVRTPTPQKPQQPLPRTSTPLPSATTITTWKLALRHVTKLSQTPNFEPAIQKLLADQTRNIRDWATGRDRLLSEQTSKRSNEEAMRAAINLPGLRDTLGREMRTPQRDEEELKSYYEKVWRAQMRMKESHMRELGRLGVPFFCVKEELIVDGDVEVGEGEREEGKVGRKELGELRRKMLNHLVELYGD